MAHGKDFTGFYTNFGRELQQSSGSWSPTTSKSDKARICEENKKQGSRIRRYVPGLSKSISWIVTMCAERVDEEKKWKWENLVPRWHKIYWYFLSLVYWIILNHQNSCFPKHHCCLYRRKSCVTISYFYVPSKQRGKEPDIESDRHLTITSCELDTNKSRIVFLRYQRDGCPDDAVRIAAASHVHFWQVILWIYHFFFQFLVHILSCQHGEEIVTKSRPSQHTVWLQLEASDERRKERNWKRGRKEERKMG